MFRITSNLRYLMALCAILLMSSEGYAVTGGQPTSPETHSSIVNIVFEKTVCSGVLVGPHSVLTAAHCRDQGGEPKVVAFIRNKIITEKCDKQEVLEHAYVPGAEKSKLKVHAPDILLLRIKNPLCHASPAFLSPQPAQTNDVVKMAGHSRWEFGHAQSTEIDMQLIDFKEVQNHILVTKDFDKKMVERFFAKGAESYVYGLPVVKNSSICPGDSGGPVFFEGKSNLHLLGVNGVVMGNVELGAKKCNHAYVQAYTPIAPYFDWLLDTINEYEGKSEY